MSEDVHYGERTGSCPGSKARLVHINNARTNNGKAEGVRLDEQTAPEYWKSLEERREGVRAEGEFRHLPEAGGTRRDFLALMGFSLAAATMGGCRAPVQYAIPLVAGSDQIIPGVSTSYATTCGACPASCGLLVKQRDGRPIKIEGNDQSPLTGGGTCAAGQATVLGLYDQERLRGPRWKGEAVGWQELDDRVAERLEAAGRSGRRIVLLSGTVNSPSTLEILAAWSRQYPAFRHVVYEPFSLQALRLANQESFGRAVIPHYAFDRARVIVGLEADFLGTWLSPVEFARQYARSRAAENGPALHVHFESGYSVTGSNADLRIPVAPSEIGAQAVSLLQRIAAKTGGPSLARPAEAHAEKLDRIADALWRHRGESLVVSGVQDRDVQVAVNALNGLLGNVGRTLDLAAPSLQSAGDDAQVAELVEQMHRGEVEVLMLHGVNPGYDHPDADRLLAGMAKVPLSISFADRLDETSVHATALCPDHHPLESWGDAEPVQSHLSLRQPLIRPLFDTRAMPSSLLAWLGRPPDHYTFLREFWRTSILPRQHEIDNFDTFWDSSLASGVRALPPAAAPAAPAALAGEWRAAAGRILAAREGSRSGDGYELHLFQNVAMRDGAHANNPWLQELPDPISKVTWGNFAAIAPATAGELGLREGDVISIASGERSVELPVFVQPGQHRRTISIAAGYGRRAGGRVAEGVGANAYPLAPIAGGLRPMSVAGVRLTRTGRHETLAGTQSHFSMEGRPIVLETTLSEVRAAAKHETDLPTLWAERLEGEHSWGMVIDLNACTGCSACVISCQAENNVPVVGRDQVERIRIMHWMRVDRYSNGSEEEPAAVHQPMMCQHCQHAPCETVCPVVATTTSSEGINQQVYNRCIGTRYCANNCPYKVRRFNWLNYTDNPRFDYNMANPLGRMVLNPDVVVRSRGVMEKCSLCVQRIQLAKNHALQGRRELADGDIVTACQQACPTQAIVFGDLKDPESRISRQLRDPRYYRVLDELGVRPNVGYLKKIRNREV